MTVFKRFLLIIFTLTLPRPLGIMISGFRRPLTSESFRRRNFFFELPGQVACPTMLPSARNSRTYELSVSTKTRGPVSFRASRDALGTLEPWEEFRLLPPLLESQGQPSDWADDWGNATQHAISCSISQAI